MGDEDLDIRSGILETARFELGNVTVPVILEIIGDVDPEDCDLRDSFREAEQVLYWGASYETAQEACLRDRILAWVLVTDLALSKVDEPLSQEQE